ncbi:MAG: hypothetical protein ACJAQ9_002732 [Ilumatobacter sp.]|jgi:hypothetical protein
MSRKDTFAADSAREAPAVKIAMNNSRDTIGINHRDQPSKNEAGEDQKRG